MTIAAVLLLLAATAVAVLYNRLVRDRNRVDAAWGDIDVQLQRRHDLVPRLVTAVDHYAKYERATLEAVTALRDEASRAVASGSAAEAGAREQALAEGVSRLIAIAESYPDLKADSQFLGLQQELVDTENYLQFARRFYNGAVRAFNTRVGLFPANIVASAFGFVEREFFQKESDDAANVPLVDFGKVE